jgi:hypothetical protein
LRQCLDERVFGKLAVSVVFVGRPDAAHSSSYAVCVPVAALRFPYPITDVPTADLAVLPDPQRGLPAIPVS